MQGTRRASHPLYSRVDRPRNAMAPHDILGEDHRTKTVLTVIRLSNNLFFRLGALDHDKGTEDFLVHNLHLIVAVCKDCWLDAVAFVWETRLFAAVDEVGAVRLGRLYVSKDLFLGCFADSRAVVGVGVELRTDVGVLLGLFLED